MNARSLLGLIQSQPTSGLPNNDDSFRQFQQLAIELQPLLPELLPGLAVTGLPFPRLHSFFCHLKAGITNRDYCASSKAMQRPSQHTFIRSQQFFALLQLLLQFACSASHDQLQQSSCLSMKAFGSTRSLTALMKASKDVRYMVTMETVYVQYHCDSQMSIEGRAFVYSLVSASQNNRSGDYEGSEDLLNCCRRIVCKVIGQAAGPPHSR